MPTDNKLVTSVFRKPLFSSFFPNFNTKLAYLTYYFTNVLPFGLHMKNFPKSLLSLNIYLRRLNTVNIRQMYKNFFKQVVCP